MLHSPTISCIHKQGLIYVRIPKMWGQAILYSFHGTANKGEFTCIDGYVLLSGLIQLNVCPGWLHGQNVLNIDWFAVIMVRYKVFLAGLRYWRICNRRINDAVSVSRPYIYSVSGVFKIYCCYCCSSSTSFLCLSTLLSFFSLFFFLVFYIVFLFSLSFCGTCYL